MNTKHKPLGIEGLGDMSWGTHFCLFYETEQDLHETLGLYFKPGLANNEFCLWITPDSSLEKTRNALRQVIPLADQRLEKGDIEILSCQQWYCENDEFDGARVLQAADTKLRQALEKGYTRMRALADEAWLDQQNWKVFSDYEGTLDQQFAGKPISILCAYPTAPHSAADILDVARTHRFVAAKRKGNWEILEAPELKHTKAETERLSAELGAQVAEQKKLHSLQDSSLILRYGLPVVAVGLSLAGTFLLQPYVFRTPLFFLSIMISTWVGGIGPGLLAVLLSTLAINVFLSPAGILETSFQNIPNVISFLITALLVSSWSEARRRAEHALRKAHDEQEDKVQERTADLRQVNHALQAEIIDHKRSEEALRVSEYRLQAAIDAADIGLWDWDLGSGQIVSLGHHDRLLGFAPGEFDGTYPSFEKRVHPEDLEELNRVVQRACDDRSEYLHEYRVIWPDGSIHWIAGQGRFVYNEARQPVRMRGAVLDITVRKRLENELRRREGELRRVIDTIPALVWSAQPDGFVDFINQRHREFTGLSLDDMRGWNWLDEFHPEDRERLEDEVDTSLATGEALETEGRLRRAHGDYRWFLLRAVPLRDEAGRIVRWYGTKTDIEDRKQAEKALQESETKLKEAQQLAKIGYWERDLIADRITWSEETGRIFGLESYNGVFTHAQLQDLIHPDDRELEQQAFIEALQGSRLFDVEARFVRPNGNIRFVHILDEMVRDESGKPIRMFGAVQDITERRWLEENLRKAELQYRTLVEHVPPIIYMAGLGQHIGVTYISPRIQILGFTQEEWLADPELWFRQIHFEDQQRVLGEIKEGKKTGGVIKLEYRIRARDGSIHWFLEEAMDVMDEGGNFAFRQGIMLDISERKQTEEQIRQHAARTEALAEISQALARVGLDAQAVFDTIAHYTAEHIGDSCTIRLLSRDRQWLNLVAFHHPISETAALLKPTYLTPMPANQEWFRQVLQTGQSIILPVIAQQQVDSLLPAEFQLVAGRFRLHSALIVPLRVEGEVIGTLSLTRVNPQGPSYTPNDQVLLQELADRAGLTIQNARLFEQVQGARERLTALSRRLLEVQEAERRALTSELHDRVGQNLTGLSINLQNMKALLSDEMMQTLATKFDDAQALLEDTTRQIRDIMAKLHLPELEDYGLAVALETYAERVASRGHLKLIADLPDLAVPRLPYEVRIALFRAAQEAINNVLKHAEATQLEISLEERDGRIRLGIEDDGRGFEPEAVSQREAQTWGLKIMRERIELIGGNVQVELAPGVGTRVAIEIGRPA